MQANGRARGSGVIAHRRTYAASVRVRDIPDRVTASVFALVALCLYVPYLARYPTEWDGVQLTFGLDRFDISQHSPHPPGYYLYVLSGRLVRVTTPLSGSRSLQVVAAIAAAATVGLAYLLGREMSGRWLGLATAGFLLTSPFLWFYGVSVATYSFDALLSVGLLLLACRARPGSWHPVAAALVLGLGAGLRQTSLILLAPIVLVAAGRGVRSVRRAVQTAVAGVAGILVWLVPMLQEQPGGLREYRHESVHYLHEALRATSPFYGAPQHGFRNNVGQATGYTVAAVEVLLPATALAMFLFLVTRGWRQRRAVADGDEGVTRSRVWGPALLATAVVPSILFVLLFQFGKAGYVLSYLPALALLLLWPATRLPPRHRLFVGAVLALGYLVDGQRFVSGIGALPISYHEARGPWFAQEQYGAPYPVTARTLHIIDRDTREYLAIGRELDPRRDVLAYVWGNGAQRYRHAMYTLPTFTTHLVRNGDELAGRRRHSRGEYDHVLEVPPGGDAAFVLDTVTPEMQRLIEAGTARRFTLSTGPTVFLVHPGTTIFGVTVRETPDALERALGR